MANSNTNVIGSFAVSNFRIGLQSGTNSTLYAVWNWYQPYTEKYHVIWKYYTGDGVWFVGSESDETVASTATSVTVTYNAPSNAYRVACTVQPISSTYEKTKGKTKYEAHYWQAETSTEYYTFSTFILPENPPVPTVTIDSNFRLVAKANISDAYTSHVQYEVVKNNQKTVKTGITKVTTGVAGYAWKVDAGGEYKVRARGLRGAPGYPIVQSTIKRASAALWVYSDWSDYSSSIKTVPLPPAKITRHTMDSANSVWLYWDRTSNTDSYTIEYAKSKLFFDASTETQTITVTVNRAHITGLDTGTTWYFRIKSTNAQGDSAWCNNIYSIVTGSIPTAPTTWSQTSTAIVGESVNLYWVHNSVDGSTQKNAVVQVALDNGSWSNKSATYLATEEGVASYLNYKTYLTESSDVDDDNLNDILDANGNVITALKHTAYAEGTVLKWRVKTKGVMNTGGTGNDGYGPWSAIRYVVFYGPPSVELVVTGTSGSAYPDYIYDSFPIYIYATAAPSTQTVVGWNISIVSDNTYEAYDDSGQRTIVSAGDEVYSEFISGGSNNLTKIITPSEIRLENEQTYTIKVHATMDSGLDAEDSQQVKVNWATSNLWPNAEVAIDDEKLYAYIRPFCLDDDGNLIDDVTLAVYRREYDGRFTEIATNLENSATITVVDPHPALDYARYRIVATSVNTGQVGFYDLPGVWVGETGIVIQWNEEWSNFNLASGDGDGLVDASWTGSMIKLPYNIKISEASSVDTALVEYIGRSAPVSYYGTQLGISGSWSSEIPASDIDTRYALRRLQIWRGDAYVRAPNGVGYWANVKVTFNNDYNSMLMPVTLDVTRVEGGI